MGIRGNCFSLLRFDSEECTHLLCFASHLRTMKLSSLEELRAEEEALAYQQDLQEAEEGKGDYPEEIEWDPV